MKEIGGYFELELNKGLEYHKNLIKLNTGRNAFELILLTRGYSKVFLPLYTCDVLLEPLIRNNIKYEFYSIDNQLEIEKPFPKLQTKEVLVYTNYFGIKTSYVEDISKTIKNLIIDNSQAFFDMPISGVDTFYSPRKFFGVGDGGYLSLDMNGSLNYSRDISLDRINHLIGRIEFGAEAGYNFFRVNEENLSNQPIKLMSKLTRRILCSIDYPKVRKIRIGNFNFLQSHLGKHNELSLDLFRFNHSVPMAYPLLLKNDNLRKYLLESKIFVGTYWPNILSDNFCNSWEYYLTKYIIPLPIDQRYGITDMKNVLDNIRKIIK